jgi:hypothetical protein
MKELGGRAFFFFLRNSHLVALLVQAVAGWPSDLQVEHLCALVHLGKEQPLPLKLRQISVCLVSGVRVD